MAATASCGTAMDRSAPSRPGLGQSRSGAPRCATGPTSPRRRKSASPHRSCRSGRGGPRASMRCCRFSTCGASTGDFQEALTALLGKDAPNLSPAVVARLTAEWQADYDAWQKRNLSPRRYVHVWADGVYLQARMEESAECMLVLIGATPRARKNSSASRLGCGRARRAGASSSSTSSGVGSRSRRPRCRRRRARLLEGDRGDLSLYQAPTLLGSQDYVLNKVALSVQVNMKADLREIYGASTRGRRVCHRRVRREIRRQIREGGIVS
jgi:hypothetical protein